MKNLIVVTGSAGFVGANLIKHLLKNTQNLIIGFDDFTLGNKKLVNLNKSRRYKFYNLDINNYNKVKKIINKYNYEKYNCFFYHLASNSDVKKSEDLKIDTEKTLLTTISASRLFLELGFNHFIFTSSPVVFGEVSKPINYNTKMNPISNYGFAKYFSEIYIKKNIISKNVSRWLFRFPNVVGPHLTHGILYDFNNKIKKNNKYLEVLGDGNQQKPYLYVSDIVKAISLPTTKKFLNFKGFQELNLSPLDNGIKVRDIVELFVKYKKLKIKIKYSGGKRGWKGDVPKYSYDFKKNKHSLWMPRFNSKNSIIKSIKDLK
tara:strand:+ start:6183 stop:7136 length:954 start_codon:yes stop_codon:yes gene_type:complete